MATLSDDDGFVSVTRVETSDLALGGNEVNVPNKQFVELASRDRWLRDQLEAVNIIGDATVTASLDTFRDVGMASIAQGRLTAVSGNPTPTSDQLAVTTIRYTPYDGDRVALWNGAESRWDVLQFTERSLSLSGLLANTNYDIFLFDNAGTLTLEAVAWSNSGAGTGTRASAISRRNGVWVKTSDNRRYLGTIRITGTAGQTESSLQNRYIWNVQNQVPGFTLVQMIGIGVYAYSSTAWRAANNSTTYQIRFVAGLEVEINAVSGMLVSGSATGGSTGIGLNSTTVNSGQIFANKTSATDRHLISSNAILNLPIGHNYLQMLESGSSGTNFEGDSGDLTGGISGMLSNWRY